MSDRVRFWVYVNGGYVRVTLRAGVEHQLEHNTFEYTDEGARSEWRGWSLEDGVLYHIRHTRERDCDAPPQYQTEPRTDRGFPHRMVLARAVPRSP